MLDDVRLKDRFEIEEPVARGSMGDVYRGRDCETGAKVAIKRLPIDSPEQRERFLREVESLARIDHPRVVKYVDHVIEPRAGWIVMEWVEGVSLRRRLGAGALSLDDTLRLGGFVGDALAAAHAQGIVHRDVKPGNLIVQDGDLEKIKLIDFSVAVGRFGSKARPTLEGVPIGTVSYMSPEQARGERDVDARADVYSLGAVLFECLSGRRAFGGEHPTITLTRIIMEPAPRLRSFMPELPDEVDAFVARLMQKDRRERLASGAEVADWCRRLRERFASERKRGSSAPPAMGAAEQRFVWVVMTSAVGDSREGGRPDDDPTLEDRTAPNAVQSTALLHDAEGVTMLGGAFAATIVAEDVVESAGRALQLALALRMEHGARQVVVAMGRALSDATVPVGDAIERAAVLLDESTAGIVVDSATAALLSPRYAFQRHGAGQLLLKAHDSGFAPRRLLGRPAPFVGREPELARVWGTFDKVVASRTGRAVFFVGAPGIGKSRLLHEATALLRSHEAEPIVLHAFAPTTFAATPFGALADFVRRAARLGANGHPGPTRRDAWLDGLGISDDDARTVLGWLARDAQSGDEQHDPGFDADRATRAVAMWLEAATRDRAIVAALDDFEVADRASTDVLGRAMRGVGVPMLLLVGSRRPPDEDREAELHALGVDTISVKPLESVAIGELVYSVLGREGSSLASEFARTAEGNPLLVEELIRLHVEAGHAEANTTGVVALAARRFEKLPPDARRTLRAASAFGTRFRAQPLIATLGGSETAMHVLEHLRIASAAELVRDIGDGEHEFAHAVLRDAAYGSLTDVDRVITHQGIATALERDKTTNDAAASIATHWELAGRAERALPWLLRAAEHAQIAGGLVECREYAERALAIATDAESLGIAHGLLAQAAAWRGELTRAVEHADKALELLPVGHSGRYVALIEGMVVLLYAGRDAEVHRFVHRLAIEGSAEGEALDPLHAIALLRGLRAAQMVNLPEAAELQSAVRAIESRLEGAPPEVRAWHVVARASEAWAQGRLDVAVTGLLEGFEQFVALRAYRRACAERNIAAEVLVDLGAYAEAIDLLDQSARTLRQLGGTRSLVAALNTKCEAAMRLGKLDTAWQANVAAFEVAADMIHSSAGSHLRMQRAVLHWLQDPSADVEGELERAEADLPPHAGRIDVSSWRVRILGARGRIDEALEVARTAIAHVRNGPPARSARPFEIGARVARDAGRRDEAKALVHEGLDLVRKAAAMIADPKRLHSFWHAVPFHRGLLELDDELRSGRR